MGGLKRRRAAHRIMVMASTLAIAAAIAPPALADEPDPDWFTEADPIAVTSSTGRVRAFARIGDVVYVGGNHTTLRDSVGGPDLGGPYIGAVARREGSVIASFSPQLDGEVRALAVSPDGTRLYVGGRFQTVNGEAWANFVVLDPVTGERIDDIAVTGGGVDAIEVGADGAVYLGGGFSRINGVARSRIGAVDGTTGETLGFEPPDTPDTVRTIALSPDGELVYYGGGFTDRANSVFRGFLHAAARGDGSIDGSFAPDVEDVEVFDIAVHEDRIYAAMGGLGGRAKAFRTDGSTRARWRADGDVQTVAVVGNRVVFGGHFIEHFGSHDTRVIAAFETAGLDFDPDLWFDLRGPQGAWEIFHDEEFLWIGGDINDARPRSVRGFARFTARTADLTPPTQPGAPTVEATGAGELTVAWAPSTDDTHFVEYDVFRNGAPWRTISTASVVDMSVLPDTRYEYFVVAVDRTGKESPPSSVGAAWSAPPVDTVLIGESVGWRFLDTGEPPPAGWTGTKFDTTSWKWGRPVLGFGEGDETTIVDGGPAGDRHPAIYFRRAFNIPKGARVFALELDVEFDDGVVVHLNGSEVARSNIGSGVVTHETLATTGVDRMNQSFAIDPALVRTGKNTLAVEVHQASPQSSDLRFTAGLRASIVRSEVLISPKSTWRFDDDGVGEAGWRLPGFDDSRWGLGRAPLGTGAKATTVLDDDVTTIFFRRAFQAGDLERFTGLGLRVRDNDGYIVRLNGVVVARVGLQRPIGASTPAVRSAPNHRYRTFLLPVDLVRVGDNLLTVEIHRHDESGNVFLDATLSAVP